MPDVNVEINGRKYRIACEEGQEPHLEELAARFNKHIEGFRGSFGEIGDNRLTVMAGIAVLDELAEAEARIAALRRELDEVTEAGRAMAQEGEDLETRFAQRMAEVARKIEAVATAIDEIGQNGNGSSPA
ncbi:MAG TPA: cell division protein ZapA [Devosiaceae bacterium]